MLIPLIALLALAAPAYSATIDGLQFCVGPYALCSTSTCQSIPGNSTHVQCGCQGPFDGLNVGNTTCKQRTERLISTFSIQEEFTSAIQPPLYSFECTGDNAAPWASCLDAPCSTESGFIVCTCPLYSASSNFYLGEKCPANEAETKKLCSQLRSTGSGTSDLTELKSLFGSFYGNPPSAKNCTTADNETSS